MMTKKTRIILSAILGIVLLIIIFMPKNSDVEKLDEIAVTDSVKIEEIVYKYGIPIDDYHVNYGFVKRNQSVSVILRQHGLSMSDVYRLSEKSKDVFDVRKIQRGKSYAVFSTKDSIAETVFFVYEKDPREYVVFDLRDEYRVTIGQNPVEWKPMQVAGEVESSLWMSMKKFNAEPQLAVELANIFGWTIDFFGIQNKDKFSVLYDQEYVDGRGLLNFKIQGASFTYSDSTYYAIPFEQDGEILYYHANGHSLEGAFLKAPLDFFRISSRFSNSRFHPVLKRYRAHHGVDYAAPIGTPVYAIGSGKVIAKAYQARGGGNYVKIKHNSVYTTTSMHLSRFAKGLKVGSVVKQKQVIGYVGSTGLSTGPHLDFRVFENGKPINPLTIKSQPKKPISKANMARFTVVRDSIIQEIKNIGTIESVKQDEVVLKIDSTEV